LESKPQENFASCLNKPDSQIDLCEAALWVAAEEYPSLDVSAYLAQLDGFAQSVQERLAPTASAADRVVALNRVLFDEQGFTGNRDDYYDPRNSYLNEVLDRRTGIPITLCLVYIGVAQRLGLEAAGVSFPGHFLTRVEASETLIVDPFIGEVLGVDDCQRRLAAAVGPGEILRPAIHLKAARPREILVRLLSNLKGVFAAKRDLERVVACLDRILIAMPAAHTELRDRGLVFEQLGYFAAAASDLARFLEVAPNDPSAAAIAQRLKAVRLRVRLH
jgi:regulator of sirC expression with transglutaminase-like and TPR domain